MYRDYIYKPRTFIEMRAQSPVVINPRRYAHTHVCARSSFAMKENRISVSRFRTRFEDNGIRVFLCSCGSTQWYFSGESMTIIAKARRADVTYPIRLTPGLQEF